MMQMMVVMAEFQRNIIVENVKMGMKQRARNGKWNGGQVLGYDVVEVPFLKERIPHCKSTPLKRNW